MATFASISKSWASFKRRIQSERRPRRHSRILVYTTNTLILEQYTSIYVNLSDREWRQLNDPKADLRFVDHAGLFHTVLNVYNQLGKLCEHVLRPYIVRWRRTKGAQVFVMKPGNPNQAEAEMKEMVHAQYAVRGCRAQFRVHLQAPAVGEGG